MSTRVELASLAVGQALATKEGLVRPAVGASVYIYKQGTTTPAPIYEGAEGETELAQPLISREDGTVAGWAAPAAVTVKVVYQSVTSERAALIGFVEAPAVLTVVSTALPAVPAPGKVSEPLAASVARKRSFLLTGDGATKNFTLEHNLETASLIVQMFLYATGVQVVATTLAEILVFTNQVEIKFGTAPVNELVYLIPVIG